MLDAPEVLGLFHAHFRAGRQDKLFKVRYVGKQLLHTRRQTQTHVWVSRFNEQFKTKAEPKSWEGGKRKRKRVLVELQEETIYAK